MSSVPPQRGSPSGPPHEEARSVVPAAPDSSSELAEGEGTSRGTLPPPEFYDRPAPASVSELVLDEVRATAPLSRHSGSRAELAWNRTRIEALRALGDAEGERDASIVLSRMLAQRGIDLDTAATLARRALALGDDPALRAELAGWLAGLGEPALAALTLRGLRDGKSGDTPSVGTLVRIAVLLARADDVAGAADALREAAAIDPREAIACELLGTLAAWASEDVTAEVAAEAYLEAAKRREASKEKEAAFEDRLRAFEIAPEDEAASQAVAAMLAARGRSGAADEVLRAHAGALAPHDPSRAREVHRRRMMSALKEGDAARAVGAALDAGIEGRIEVDTDAKLEEVLAHAGLYELFAARLELRAERRRGAARADEYAALARLYAGPLASPDRAMEAWIEAAASDPESSTARDALRDHANSMHDPAPLLEALVRIGRTSTDGDRPDPGKDAARASAMRELAVLAEDRLADPVLATWAWRRLAGLGLDTEAAANAVERLAPRVRAHDDMLVGARRALETAESDELRLEALRRISTLMRGRPDEPRSYLDVLSALVRMTPGERSVQLGLERLCWRLDDTHPLEEIVRERLDGNQPRASLVRARMFLATIARRRGDEAGALEAVAPLLEQAPGHRAAASAVLVLASRAGRSRERAEALVQLAGPVWAGLKAVLLAVAAELYATPPEAAPPRTDADVARSAPQPPDLGTARRLAEQACEADPTCARAVAALSAVTIAARGRDGAVSGDRVAAAALERAMGVVVPRGSLCDALAEALEGLGEPALALAWTQRWLALRPGCPRAIAELIRRSVRARDGARLSDALAWVLAQPEPLRDLAEAFGDALLVLFELDSSRAAAVARRALDVFGPRTRVLRQRLLTLSDRAGDAGLAIAVLERTLASDATEPPAALLMELFARRLRGGDFDSAAHELARAAEQGAEPSAILDAIEELSRAQRDADATPAADGLISMAVARAIARTAMVHRDLTPMDEADPRVLAGNAWRELGGLRWDLADDHQGAEEAFYLASGLGGDSGLRRYALDVCEFAGPGHGIHMMLQRAEALANGDRRERAQLYIEIASLAGAAGLSEQALSAASAAIDLDASRADAVALVEKNAGAPGGLEVLDRTYERLAHAALGCYGRRAAHYRAARQLERRGSVELALRHAIACFEAVPAEGTTYVLLARLAERAGDTAEVVRAIERVAETAGPDVRSGWLKRAAELAGRTAQGRETRFDVLLRALHVRPDPAVVAQIGLAFRDLVAAGSDEELLRMRLSRAVKTVLPRLEGPDGARTGVALARVALENLAAPALGAQALVRAMAADGDIEEFATLRPLMPALAEGGEVAATWLSLVAAEAEKPYSSVGPSLLRLASGLAGSVGDERSAASLLVQAARRAPDDDGLMQEADVAVRALRDDALVRALDAALPVERRVEALLHLAAKHEREGRDDEAIATLQRAVETGRLSDPDRERAVLRMRHLLGVAGRSVDVEKLLRREIAREDVTPELRVKLARDLGSQLAARGDWEGSLEVLAETAQRVPLDRTLLTEVQRLARRTGDRVRQIEVMRKLADVADSDASRLSALHDVLSLLREGADRAALTAVCETILAIEPNDRYALEALEYDAGEHGDREGLATILGRRIAAAPSPEARRTLRLRRAAVLEQRLGRLDEACTELETLLSEVPEDTSALRFLADVRERLGTPLRAAPLWRKLGELALASDEKAEYGLRAAGSYLAGGDVASARTVLEQVSGIAPREAVVELRVELARREGDPRALSDALDQLASSSREPADKRAEILVEAARAASAIGDDAAALDRARRAAKLAPGSADAVLEARRLEYLARGPGTPREAQATVDELNAIADALKPEQVELHVFLLAEELDVIQGGGAGMRELSRRHAEIGPRPLVTLGMAERLTRSRSFHAALPLFEQALAGDLRGMRARGRVALAAAEAAVAASELDVAARLLEEAATQPDTRALATRRQLELTAMRGEPEAAEKALTELARQTTGLDRGRALGQLARLIAARDPGGRATRAVELYEQAVALSGPDRNLHAQLADELARVRGLVERSDPPQPPSDSKRVMPLPGKPVPPLPGAPQPPPSARLPSPASGSAPASAPASASASASAAAPAPAPASASASASASDVTPIPDDTPPPAVLPPVAPAEPLYISDAPPAAEADASHAIEEIEAPTPLPTSVASTATPNTAEALEEEPAPSIPPPQSARPHVEFLDENEYADDDDEGPPARIWTVPPPPSDDEPVPTPLLATPNHASGEPAPLPASAAASDPPRPSDPEPIPASVQATGSEEQSLLRELYDGSYEAGDRLIEHWGARVAERAHEVLTVRKRQAIIRLGDRGALTRLHAAAVADHDATYARAIEHVLRGFDPTAAPVPPPPLSMQREATPEVVGALLFRDLHVGLTEALSLAWETGMFRRDANHYRLTGLERVQLGAATPVGEVYSGVARLFGTARTPLFHPRGPGALQSQIALLWPPAVILTGDVREESAELRYVLGSALAGAMPEHVLVNAWPEESVRTLIDALMAAFGPVRDGDARRDSPPDAVAKLERDLWQLIPPRAARRLSEILAAADDLSFESARETTRRAMRRAGLFASGSLSTAVARAIVDLRLSLPVPLTDPTCLARACERHPEIADLVRLALRMEYAAARWQSSGPSDLRRGDTGSRYRIPTQ